MPNIVINAHGLGKKYLIGHQARRERKILLRDVLTTKSRALFQKATDVLQGRPVIAGDDVEEFWALKDVDFEITRGDVVGVIGRNGAGKSTLLKVLSRITDPSEGRVEIRGRIASLLEVGTGFHSELTGRENIFLNGSILGMTRREIKRKFDEIVAFSGVEQFLDTPVKRYSSGMYTRLAFAVSAHVEPDILVVDEVLSVGDAAFQEKCLGKMRDMSTKEGRTVLFVSHNLTAIASLCRTGILLSRGRASYVGPIDTTIDAYMHQAFAQQEFDGEMADTILKAARLVALDYSTEDSCEGVTLTIEFELNSAVEEIGLDLVVRPSHSQEPSLFCSSAYFSDLRILGPNASVVCELGPINLALGSYAIDVRVCKPMVSWLEEHHSLLQFQISRQLAARRAFELSNTRLLGSVIPRQIWTLRQ